MSEENKEEQSEEFKAYDKWFDSLPEERLQDIDDWFWSKLRNSQGNLCDFGFFIFMAWHFITLEGGKALFKRKEASEKESDEICSECGENHAIGIDLDPETEQQEQSAFIRWRISNKNTIADLYEYFYSQLLNFDGEKIEMDEFVFYLWRFVDPEGKKALQTLEQEVLDENKRK